MSVGMFGRVGGRGKIDFFMTFDIMFWQISWFTYMEDKTGLHFFPSKVNVFNFVF